MNNKFKLLARNFGVFKVNDPFKNTMNRDLSYYAYVYNFVTISSIQQQSSLFEHIIPQATGSYVRHKSTGPINTIIMFVPQQEVCSF